MIDNQDSGKQDCCKPENGLNAENTDSGGVDDLHYEEPPVMTSKDNLGVGVALIALGIIGFMGYIWLTPGKSIGTMFSPPETQVDEVVSQAVESDAAEVEHQKCATCGMFADKSASHVVVEWADDSTTHHDGWDCAFGFGSTNGMDMAGVEISHFGSPLDSPHFLDATAAWFLYDTEASVEGSMPPFVAAFSTKDEAMSKQGEMGGELLDYEGLAGKWDITSTAAPEDHSTMDMNGHDMAAMDSQQDMEMATGEAETMPGADSTPEAQNHDHKMNCSYCGMFADKSQSHVIASWTDGNHTHHDGWDCMFFYGSENGLSLASAEVGLLGSPVDNPEWIDAKTAWYLYDMDKAVPGSMPPFVGAVPTEESAQSHQGEWGGEILNFTNLSAKWQKF